MPETPKKVDRIVAAQGTMLFMGELRKYEEEERKREQLKLVNTAEDRSVKRCMEIYAKEMQDDCIKAVKDTADRTKELFMLK